MLPFLYILGAIHFRVRLDCDVDALRQGERNRSFFVLRGNNTVVGHVALSIDVLFFAAFGVGFKIGDAD